tara:strand:- start:167 stop:442 length:276 start_codon:yes stop_codon:yes gene_type:complete
MEKLAKIAILSVLLGVSINAMSNDNYTHVDNNEVVEGQYSNADRIATMTAERRAIVMERSASIIGEQKSQMKAGQETMKDRRDAIRYKRVT